MFIVAGIFAGVFAYLWNRWILTRVGDKGLIVIIPLVEEVAKSGAALLLETNFLGTHFIFGCIEGIYDIITSSKKIGNWAALASIISHSFFGGTTYLVHYASGSISLAIFVAWLFHTGWNWYITKYV